MADDIIDGPNEADEHEQSNPDIKKNRPMAIVGYNLIALAGYTILCFLLASQGGFILDAFFLLGHVSACLIMALANRSWIWFLSGILVLAIGFSTCVTIMGTGGIG